MCRVQSLLSSASPHHWTLAPGWINWRNKPEIVLNKIFLTSCSYYGLTLKWGDIGGSSQMWKVSLVLDKTNFLRTMDLTSGSNPRYAAPTRPERIHMKSRAEHKINLIRNIFRFLHQAKYNDLQQVYLFWFCVKSQGWKKWREKTDKICWLSFWVIFAACSRLLPRLIMRMLCLLAGGTRASTLLWNLISCVSLQDGISSGPEEEYCQKLFSLACPGNLFFPEAIATRSVVLLLSCVIRLSIALLLLLTNLFAFLICLGQNIHKIFPKRRIWRQS